MFRSIGFCGLILHAVAAGVPAQPSPRAVSAATQWMELVERHEPGVLDGAALGLANLNGQELSQALRGLPIVMKQLLPERRRRLLLAGAVAHADIAVLAPDRASELVTIAGFHVTAGQGIDGEHLGAAPVTAHWEVGRRLLDRLESDPGRDDAVADWYRAVAAVMHERHDLASAELHLEHALRLFPRDPIVLLFTGAMHDAYASPIYENMRLSGTYGPLLQLRPGP